MMLKFGVYGNRQSSSSNHETMDTEVEQAAIPTQTAELRRRLYERIAQGNNLAEVEESAQRQWQRS